MKRNESITHIMSETIITANQNQKVSEVRKILVENDIHHLPVVSGPKLLGIVSSSDMMRISFTAIGVDQKAVDAYLDSMFNLNDIMIKHLTTLTIKDSIRSAAELLATGKFHAIPVVDDDMNLKGIITTTDLIKYLLNLY